MRALLARLFAPLLALFLAALVAGCGFQLRGSAKADLPYQSLYVALPDGSEVGVWLRRYIKSSGGTQLVEVPTEAEAIFQQMLDSREKTILSLSAKGKVREYRLQARYAFRILDTKGKVLVPTNEITASRDMTYNDSAVLAKKQEETLLWRDISSDLASQIIRRLAIIKPATGNESEAE